MSVCVCVSGARACPVPVELGRGVTAEVGTQGLSLGPPRPLRETPGLVFSVDPTGEPPARSLQLLNIWARVLQWLSSPMAG